MSATAELHFTAHRLGLFRYDDDVWSLYPIASSAADRRCALAGVGGVQRIF
jgi:hypothetical protein